MKRVQFKLILREDEAEAVKAFLKEKNLTFTQALRKVFKIPLKEKVSTQGTQHTTP